MQPLILELGCEDMTTVPPQVEPHSVEVVDRDESNFEQQEGAGLSQAQIVRKRFVRHRAAMASLILLILIVILAATSIGWGPIPGWWKWNYYTSVGSASGQGATLAVLGIGGPHLFSLGDFPFGADGALGY